MSKDKNFLLCIGASAGGLDALGKLMALLTEEQTNFSIVIAQHLSPTHKSRLVELMQKKTEWQVKEATNGELIATHVVYITPPDKDVSIENEKIKLTQPSSSIGPKPSANFLFQTAAENYKEKCIGMVLSGTGSDGAIGLENIKTYNGYTLCQLPEEAQYDGMPRSSIETGAVDLIGSIEVLYTGLMQILGGKFSPEILTDQKDKSELDYILDLLAMKSGVSFKLYKQSTIIRRLESRLKYLKLPSLKKYIEYINNENNELDQLFKSVLIGVTQFFRDPLSFNALKSNLENLIKSKTNKTLRVWVTGCATGEEPYTIAIIISEILGVEITDYNIQIFATDIDENALMLARKGVYPKTALNEVKEDIISKYFNYKAGNYEIVKSLRTMVLFSKHDLTTNPPFLKIDLISCRNLLIYFNIELQQKVLPIFHYALNDYGLLYLGKSETLGVNDDIFSTIDKKHKIFKRKRGGKNVDYKFSPIAYNKPSPKINVKQKQSILERAREAVFENYYQPFVIIDNENNILYISGSNLSPFISPKKGPLTSDLLKYCDNDIEIELRSALLNAKKTKKEYISATKRLQRSNKQFLLRLIVNPVINIQETVYVIIFDQIEIEGIPIIGDTNNAQIEFEKLRSYELEQELAATKEHLQSYIEELETTNEEMQSLNEELQSANEELQSTNEELETSNEELQSTNEEVQIAYSELQLVNDKLKEKDNELGEINRNIQLLLNNNLQSFILINKENNILIHNDLASNFFRRYNNKKIDLGVNLFTLIKPNDANFFLNSIHNLESGQAIDTEFTFTDDDGLKAYFRINFTYLPSTNNEFSYSIGIYEITNLIDQQRIISQREMEVKEADEKYKLLFESLTEGLIHAKVILDKDGNAIDWTYKDVNTAFANLINSSRELLIGKNMLKATPWFTKETTDWLHLFSKNYKKGVSAYTEEYVKHLKKWFMVHVVKTEKRDFIATFTDITDRKELEEKLSSEINKFDNAGEILKSGFWEFDVKTEEVIWSKQTYNIHQVDPNFNVALNKAISFYSGDTKELINDSLKNCIEHKVPYDLTVPFITAKGNEITVRTAGVPILKDGQVNRVFGVFQDVSKEVKNEANLKERIKELSTTKLIATKMVEETNLENFLNFTVKNITKGLKNTNSTSCCIVLNNKTFGSFQDLKNSYRLTNEEVDNLQLLVFSNNGSNVNLTKEEKAYLESILGLLTIAILNFKNEQKLNKSELSLHKAILELNRSNEELESFAYIASHDLQEPLRMISSFTQLLAKKYEDNIDEDAVKYIDFIINGTHRLQNMIKDLLEYSRINTVVEETEEVNPRKLIERSISFFQFGNKDLEIDATFSDLPNVRGVKNQIDRLFKNLIENAIKYRGSANPLKLNFSAKSTEKGIEFAIKDNGIGVKEIHHEKIFKVFQRLHSSNHLDGSGIGLSLCKRIMKQHKGDIWIESDGENGSTFKLFFPC